MRSSTTGHNTPTATHTYSPSVPLSVYRELATELQSVEAMLDSLNAQNQQLAKQNQQLRQEIEKAVQSVFHLKQVADSAGAISWKYPDSPSAVRKPSLVSRPPHRGTHLPLGVPNVVVNSLPTRETGVFAKKVSTHEQGRYRRRLEPEAASQISGWWLAIAILLIMLTAFSAGYLIVRPLLQNR